MGRTKNQRQFSEECEDEDKCWPRTCFNYYLVLAQSYSNDNYDDDDDETRTAGDQSRQRGCEQLNNAINQQQERPATNDQRPTTNDQRPTTNDDDKQQNEGKGRRRGMNEKIIYIAVWSIDDGVMVMHMHTAYNREQGNSQQPAANTVRIHVEQLLKRRRMLVCMVRNEQLDRCMVHGGVGVAR